MVVAIILGAAATTLSAILWLSRAAHSSSSAERITSAEVASSTPAVPPLRPFDRVAPEPRTDAPTLLPEEPRTDPETALIQSLAGKTPDEALALIGTPAPGDPAPSQPASWRGPIILGELALTRPDLAIRWYREHWAEIQVAARETARVSIISAIAGTDTLKAIAAMEELERKNSPNAWHAIAARAPDAASWVAALNAFQSSIGGRPAYHRPDYLSAALPAFAGSLSTFPFDTVGPCIDLIPAGSPEYDVIFQSLDAPAHPEDTGRWLDLLQSRQPAVFKEKAPRFFERWCREATQLTASKAWIDKQPPGELRDSCTRVWEIHDGSLR